jgi:hypothetical protein
MHKSMTMCVRILKLYQGHARELMMWMSVMLSANHLWIVLNKEQQRAASSDGVRDQTAPLTCPHIYLE